MDRYKLKKAESFIQDGKLDKAEKELRELLAKNKSIIQAWLMLAPVYGQVGRFNEVVFAAKKSGCNRFKSADGIFAIG